MQARQEASAQAGAEVAFAKVTKSYGPMVALRPTTLSVERGEFFAIIGPSGSGKTTLLGVVAGFTPPSGGKVFVDGKDIVSLPPYRRNFGMVFQGYALFPHMTVAENIAFPLRMRNFPSAQIGAEVSRALSMVRLESYADRYPSQLSGGQQQRVALARAAVYNPPLLLMDEPLGALDKNLREEMQYEIKSLQAKLGATVIYVTHDQQEAAFMADRLAVMRQGRVEQIGAPREIYERPVNRFVAAFLGEATILTVDAVETIGGRPAARCGDLVLALAEGEEVRPGYAICLRPENIVLGDEARHLPNAFTGTVTAAIFSTGSVVYRIGLGQDVTLTVRTPSHPGIALRDQGSEITVGWHDSAMSILAD
jgi:putative spermidine/putrescine transport system ATP-binding protein